MRVGTPRGDVLFQLLQYDIHILPVSAATSIVERGPSTRSVYPSRAKRPARFRAAWAGRSSSAAKAADDNRSKQLNPQDPTYHASRGEAPAAAAAAAAAATQANQEKK